METIAHVLILGLLLIPLMMFFPTALGMMSAMFGMGSLIVGLPL
jgi:hypothetical protein